MNSFGIYLCEQTLGPIIERGSDGKPLPTRLLAEAYVSACRGGRIPALAEVLQALALKPWMSSGARPLSRLLAAAALG